MLTQEANTLLTHIGPGTPMGSLMRRYWIPALFADQLSVPDGAPVRVKLLGERLVAFRDTQGRIGLLGEQCPHRTASLFFGRNEESGLRCVYHGWKFDIDGVCMDVPNEPPASQIKSRVRAKAYPCIEIGGLVWTYMGPPELKPQFPQIEWTGLPTSHRLVTRHLQECNWLQALEGGFDSSHLSFLHKGDLSFEFALPSHFEFVPTEAGFICAYGRNDGTRTTWTADTLLMPFHKLISTPLPGAHVWVPIDDETTMLYSINYHPDRPLTASELVENESGDRIHAKNEAGSDRMTQNRDNDYCIDRSLQQSGKSFTGIRGVGVQDSAIQESMGFIADRTLEHLGTADIGIVQLRRFFLRAVEDFQAGREVFGLDPNAYRLRPLYTSAPKETPFRDVISAHLKADAELAPAE